MKYALPESIPWHPRVGPLLAMPRQSRVAPFVPREEWAFLPSEADQPAL